MAGRFKMWALFHVAGVIKHIIIIMAISVQRGERRIERVDYVAYS